MKIFLAAFILLSKNLIAQTDSLLPAVYSWNKLEVKQEDSRLRRQILQGHTTSLSKLEIHSSTIEAGRAPHPPHTHTDEEELAIIKEGYLKITINNNSKIMGPGSVAMMMPGDEHGFYNVGTSPATYYIFKFKAKKPVIADSIKGKVSSFWLDWEERDTTETGKGYRRNFFNQATSQLAQMEMHTTALNAGLDSHAPHQHIQEEIVLILRGKVEMILGNQTIPAGPGDIIFIPSNVSHALKNTGNEQCEYFAFQWKN